MYNMEKDPSTPEQRPLVTIEDIRQDFGTMTSERLLNKYHNLRDQADRFEARGDHKQAQRFRVRADWAHHEYERAQSVGL
jgi:hypothetical protein